MNGSFPTRGRLSCLLAGGGRHVYVCGLHNYGAGLAALTAIAYILGLEGPAADFCALCAERDDARVDGAEMSDADRYSEFQRFNGLCAQKAQEPGL